MIILDSDIFTLLTYEHKNVTRHYEAVEEGEVLAVTAITRAEVLRGRTDGVLKAADEQELLAASRRLQATEAALGAFRLLHVTEAAARHFQSLLGQKKLKMRRADMLIACIGMQMDFMKLAGRPELLAIGVIWMLTHILVIWSAARLVKAPLFYFAVGSQGNIGAAASAPVVAAAFHPSLAPVGVLLGTVGYASGTVIAYGLGQILRIMAEG